MRIDLNERELLSVLDRLSMLSLPRPKRVRLLKELGRAEIRETAKRIRTQKNTDGSPMARRKNGKRKKMFKRMASGLEPYVLNDGYDLNLTWRNKTKGRIAARHATGQTQRMTAQQVRRRFGPPNYKEPATKPQARKLREIGFTVRQGKKKRSKKPTLKWIQENLSMGKAGLIIRTMTNKPQLSAWDIPIADRPFLGSPQSEVEIKMKQLLQQAQGQN